MFQKVVTSLSLCLQGTPLEFRAKPRACHAEQGAEYSTERSLAPGYLLTTEEYRIKRDLLTRLHTCDNRLRDIRGKANEARARLFPDYHEQTYCVPLQGMRNPQIELYYRKLGLDLDLNSDTAFGC